jgi:hypothetical protein
MFRTYDLCGSRRIAPPNGEKGSDLGPGRINSGETALATHWIGGSVGNTASLVGVVTEKSLPPTESDTQSLACPSRTLSY